jgi:hypothetical protein
MLVKYHQLSFTSTALTNSCVDRYYHEVGALLKAQENQNVVFKKLIQRQQEQLELRLHTHGNDVTWHSLQVSTGHGRGTHSVLSKEHRKQHY